MRVATVAFLFACVAFAFCAAANTAAAVLEWGSCWVDQARTSRECEAAELYVPTVHDVALSNATNATLPLRMFRRMASAATATAPTLVVVSDMTLLDIYTWMDRIHERTPVNIYFASTRLRSWGTNSTVGDADSVPSPCGSLAVGAPAALTIDGDALTAVRSCHDWLRATFGALGTRMYALEAAAKDLAIQIQAAQAETHSSNVFVLAMGSASRIVQTYMALERPSPPLAGFVFDSPHALQYTSTFDAVSGASTSRFLDGCDTDAVCRRHFAALGISLRDVVNKLLLQLDKKTLKRSASACVTALATAAFDQARDLAPSHGVRRFLTMIRRDPNLTRLLPVLLYRLHRCHEQDVALLGRVWGDLQSAASADADEDFMDPADMQYEFIQQIVAFSDVWPSEVPTWRELVRAFETSPMGDGAMVQRQPSYCVYSGNGSPACAELYESSRKVNASLVLTYPHGSTDTPDKLTTGDVLILASRLSTVGSDTVAAKLYDAFAADGPASTKLLVETDTLQETELRTGASYTNRTGARFVEVVDDAAASNAAFQVLGLFLSGKLRSASGKWHMSDLVTDMATTELPGTLTSTYGNAPVALNLTLSPEELKMWFPDDQEDPFAAHLTVAISGAGLSIWYVALLVVAAVIVLLAVGCVLCVVRNKRRDLAAHKNTPVVEDTPTAGVERQRSMYARVGSSMSIEQDDAPGQQKAWP